MVIIRDISEKIGEEISDARAYIKMALENREKYPELGKLFYNLSIEEMDHMSRLHSAVADMIEKYRKEKGDPPADMQAVYDYLHKKHIDAAAEVKTLQAMYKEG